MHVQVNIRVKAQFLHIFSLFFFVLPSRIIPHKFKLFPHYSLQLCHNYWHFLFFLYSHQQYVSIVVSYLQGTHFINVNFIMGDFHMALGFYIDFSINFFTIVLLFTRFLVCEQFTDLFSNGDYFSILYHLFGKLVQKLLFGLRFKVLILHWIKAIYVSIFAYLLLVFLVDHVDNFQKHTIWIFLLQNKRKVSIH